MENSHDGHRQRLRERMLQDGPEALQPHEVVEFLLFYVIPRKNINPLAHALLDRFGNLQHLFGAPVEEIIKVEGMSIASAEWLKLVGLALQEYIRAPEEDVIMSNRLETRLYLEPLFRCRRIGECWAYCIDSNGFLLSSLPLTESPVWHAPENMRIMFSKALSSHAYGIVIAQKKARGQLKEGDIEHNNRLVDALNRVQITLLEHVVFDDRGKVAHYLVEPKVRQSQIAETSPLLAHWLDEE